MKGLREALRMYRRTWRVRKRGFRRYKGAPEEICRAIIADAYDKEKGYFRVSSGHFCEYYVRDFCWCCDALLALGYTKEVESTVAYALSTFMRAGKIATMITPYGQPYDFPAYGPDVLGFFLLTLKKAGTKLTHEQTVFLQGEVERFLELVDTASWLPRTDKRFTSMRDHSFLHGSCYDMTMICLVAKMCEELGLWFPLPSKELRDILIRTYWCGTHFYSDLHWQDVITGDANTIPFWTGVVDDRKMEESALRMIRDAKLDLPFPLKYVHTDRKHHEEVSWHAASVFSSDYETDSVWAHLGLIYIELLRHHNGELAERYLRKYASLIRRHGTFLEVYDWRGRPYRTPFYVTDEAMLWCAMWLSRRS